MGGAGQIQCHLPIDIGATRSKETQEPRRARKNCFSILGVIPLLPDVFFVNMTITMMAGLGFATVLTLVAVPTLYAILFRIGVPR